MVIRITTLTILTFLFFAVSSIALDPVVLPGSDVVITTTVNDRFTVSEKTQPFDVSMIDPEPCQIISRSHPIKRHPVDRTTRDPLRFVRHHPCRKLKKMFMIPTKMFYGNDMILSDKTTSVNLKTSVDRIPMKRIELHKYGHRHHHDKDEKLETTKFNGERLNSITGHHKYKNIEHKGGFMRRVCRFLKHTFDR